MSRPESEDGDLGAEAELAPGRHGSTDDGNRGAEAEFAPGRHGNTAEGHGGADARPADARSGIAPRRRRSGVGASRPLLVLDEFLPYRLSVAANAVSQVIARSYEGATGMKTNEWRVVAVLAQDGSASQQHLAVRTQVDKVAVSRAVKGLADLGFVTRTQDPGDARSLIVSLTEDGLGLYGKLAPIALALEEELTRRLSGKDVAALESLLLRLEKAAALILDRADR